MFGDGSALGAVSVGSLTSSLMGFTNDTRRGRVELLGGGEVFRPEVNLDVLALSAKLGETGADAFGRVARRCALAVHAA
mgnify:FL=1